MDTTTSSVFGGTDDAISFNTTYVSCMKVDGYPILPPLMTERRREEMRRYKEQAILKERALQERKVNKTFEISKSNETLAQNESSITKNLTFSTATSNTSPVDLPELTENRSRSTSPTPGTVATSTPRIRRTYSVQKTSAVLSPTEFQFKDTPDVAEGALGERLNESPPLDLNKSMISSVPSADGSSAALSYDGDEEKCPSESDDQKSDENFASAASSTGTFVIRRSSGNNQDAESGLPVGTLIIKTQVPEDYATSSSSSEEEQDNNKRDAPQTVLRNPSAEDVGFKRKRPAKYFDLEDEEPTDQSKCSTYASIPNYVPEKFSDSHNKSSLLADSSGTSSRFSPVPITNFSSIAKSLANEFTKKFCNTSEFSSAASTANQSATTDKPKRSSGGSYDVRLSTDIPSSAEEAEKDRDDEISNSSDKENIDTNASSKHVRKLSYTLASPSAALLEAVSKSTDKLFVQTLETVPSAPSSVGIQSAYQTPEKSNVEQVKVERKQESGNNKNSNRRYFDETIDGTGQVTAAATLTKKDLSGLNSGQGKQEHLKRFLGEQEKENLSSKASSSSATTPNLNESAQSTPRAVEDMQQILRNMQKEHENQLRRLAEQHRVQELRIRQEFESEMEKLKDKFSSSLNTTDSSRGSNKTSPNSVLDSVNISTRSLSQTNASTSVALPVSISEETTVNTTNNEKSVASDQSSSVVSEQKNKHKNSSVFQFTGGSSAIGEIPSSCASTFVNNGGTVTELSAVGLSRLQSRMQLMSPKLFRTPVDVRSPLLKGLLFLDPLDKPVAPLRIPQKALDPDMKPKFDRISAAVKGFLIRRILNTEKVQIIVQTIRDTVDLLFKLYEESPSPEDTPSVKPQDTELHKRLIQQLTGACRSFHDVFFKLTTKERMAIIATDREKLKAKALRSISSPARPNISNATLKSIERRMSHHTRSSPKRDHRKPRSSKAYNPYHGSQSVKPKAIKVYDISPKRRRISYWDERNTLTRSTPSLVGGKQDLNGNNFKGSAKSQTSSRTAAKNYQVSAGASGIMGETFIVPSAMQTPRNTLGSSNSVKSYMGSLSGRRESSTPANSKSASARSTQSAVSVASASSSSGANRSRASMSRQPWNSSRRN